MIILKMNNFGPQKVEVFEINTFLVFKRIAFLQFKTVKRDPTIIQREDEQTY